MTTNIEVPGFQHFMTPFLKVLENGETKHIRTIIDEVITLEKLTPQQCAVKLPSQNDTQVVNRIAWVRTYLYKGGLIQQVTRGNYRITKEGIEVLKRPERINVKFLKTLEPFKQWMQTFSKDKIAEVVESDEEDIRTPHEKLDSAYNTIMDEVAAELLDRLKKSTPAFFEKLVVDVLLAMGYGGFDSSNGEVTKYSGDGGIDGIIKEDKLGLDTIYIQAKRWENVVTISAVRDFAGSLLSKKARKGVFITTSTFPKSAYDFVDSIDPTIILIDGEQLTKMMIEYGVSVTVTKRYEIKRIDSDYFDL
ncbi:MAG: restriction endonuclease [Nostocales cyanobacterium 94392]|nr:restriction endonuclease [Nostocales cyanobacterium 94392]